MSGNAKTLYDPHTSPSASPEQQMLAVHTFLRQCRAWAEEREIPKRSRSAKGTESPESAAKLEAWLSYVRFLNHTIVELEEGSLDHWFRED
jgi:hypothetical protein